MISNHKPTPQLTSLLGLPNVRFLFQSQELLPIQFLLHLHFLQLELFTVKLHRCGSNVDVTAYADEVVQRMKVSQELIDTDLVNPTEERPLTAQGQNTPNASHVSEFVRTSTPTPPEQSAAEEVSLSLLEST